MLVGKEVCDFFFFFENVYYVLRRQQDKTNRGSGETSKIRWKTESNYGVK